MIFWDELERIERAMLSPTILCKVRVRAYWEFCEKGEPALCVGHTSGPRRAEVPREGDGDSRWEPLPKRAKHSIDELAQEVEMARG